MKIGFLISYFLLVFTFSSYSVNLPSEGYTSPYASSEKTSIWGSSIEPDNLYDGSVGASSSSPMKAGEHGTWAWCPYCVALWGYGPETNYDYFDCLASPEAAAGCTDPTCEVHGTAAETPLPISNSIIPLLIFAFTYAFFKYKKHTEKMKV